METGKKTNWGKIAIGAAITFGVCLVATTVAVKYVVPMLPAKKA